MTNDVRPETPAEPERTSNPTDSNSFDGVDPLTVISRQQLRFALRKGLQLHPDLKGLPRPLRRKLSSEIAKGMIRDGAVKLGKETA